MNVIDLGEPINVPATPGADTADGEIGDRPSGRLPRINAGDQHLPRVTNRAWGALEEANGPPRLFRHGGLPVRIEGGENGSLILRPLSVDRLYHEVARAAYWFKRNRQGEEVPSRPPRDVVSDILADPNPRLPVLERIVQVPVFL